MSALMDDYILEAIDRVSDWDVSATDLPHVIEETATALAGRWLDDHDLAASIHRTLHG